MTWHQVCPLLDVRGGEMRPYDVAGRPIVVVHDRGSVSAFPDRCLHKGVPLSRGRLEGGVITCWAHEWQYDACSGAGINPDNVALRRLPLKVLDGRIYVDVDPT